jgi:GNAT superfamily N-acetyltransferase
MATSWSPAGQRDHRVRATLAIGEGAAVSMLCDLFVDPRAHGLGCGQAMLAAMWPGQPSPA